MKYIQPMTCSDFAKYLSTLETGDLVEFGCDPGVDWPDEVPDLDDITAWYFAKVIEIPEYESRYILIDYAGGESAFAIPLNYYKEYDAATIPDFLKKFFAEYCPDLSGVDDFVFVEMEEGISDAG